MPASGSSSAVAAKKARPPSAELLKLQNGDWTLEQYLEDRVSRAVAKLPPGLTTEQLDTVRDTLRLQVACDPTLQEVVAAIKRNRQTPAAR